MGGVGSACFAEQAEQGNGPAAMARPALAR
jgi:hypothetical protein